MWTIVILRLTDRIDATIGIDTVSNDRYFLLHPFPQPLGHRFAAPEAVMALRTPAMFVIRRP